MSLFPASARIQGALAFKDGARKYGPYNWRESGVTASVYVNALQRHLDAWFDGEDVASDSGVHHLGHVIACAAIIIDAEECMQLNDDRPPPGTAYGMHTRFMEPMGEPAPEKAADPRINRVRGILDFCGRHGNTDARFETDDIKALLEALGEKL